MFSSAERGSRGSSRDTRSRHRRAAVLPFVRDDPAMNIAIFYGWADVLIPKPETQGHSGSRINEQSYFHAGGSNPYNGMINFPN